MWGLKQLNVLGSCSNIPPGQMGGDSSCPAPGKSQGNTRKHCSVPGRREGGTVQGWHTPRAVTDSVIPEVQRCPWTWSQARAGARQERIRVLGPPGTSREQEDQELLDMIPWKSPHQEGLSQDTVPWHCRGSCTLLGEAHTPRAASPAPRLGHFPCSFPGFPISSQGHTAGNTGCHLGVSFPGGTEVNKVTQEQLFSVYSLFTHTSTSR